MRFGGGFTFPRDMILAQMGNNLKVFSAFLEYISFILSTVLAKRDSIHK